MSEHLHLAARKKRPRRIKNDGPVYPCGLAIPTIFDRLEVLQQQIRAVRPQKPVEMLLVTNDRYLSLALTQYLFKRTRTLICSTLEEVESYFEQTPLPHVVIDLDCIAIPIIHVLDTIRAWHRVRPDIAFTLLTASRSPEASCFIVAAATCRVLERRLEIGILSFLLMQPPCSPSPAQANYTRQNDALSAREWNILMEVAKGHTLKSIAQSLKKPYHYVVYTLGRLSARIGLSSRKALIHLLHELSVTSSERNS